LPSEDLIEILNEGANENTMVARVLRHVEDRPVCPRPEDFYEAMKYDPAVVVRLHISPTRGSFAIDCRYRDGDVEYTHDFRDRGGVTKDAFVYDVRNADDVKVRYHADSQFGDGWVCYDCGEESFDPDGELIQSQNVVRVTCPECGVIDEIPQGSQPPREGCDDGLVTDGGQSTSGTDRSDPTEDPRACSRCGVHMGFLGDDYCDPCAREIGARKPIVRCMGCSQDAPQEKMEPVDISSPDEYYPTIRYLCRDCSGGESDAE